MSDMPTTTRPRPLSPHLSIYKPQISSVLSIMHRMTGAANALGAIILGLWIWAAAYDVDLFGLITTAFSHWVGQLFLIGWTFSVFYHLFNGIRHLFWDAGKGFELPTMARSGWVVVILSVVMTAITWSSQWMEG